MKKSITQDMAYRQSLMKFAAKNGVSKASRKYNKSRSYIYFWLSRWDGSVEKVCKVIGGLAESADPIGGRQGGNR